MSFWSDISINRAPEEIQESFNLCIFSYLNNIIMTHCYKDKNEQQNCILLFIHSFSLLQMKELPQ